MTPIPPPDPLLFKFDKNPDTPEFNWKIMETFDRNLDHEITAQSSSPLPYSSDIRPVDIIQPLLTLYPFGQDFEKS